jgi:hypothetical protein
VRTVFWSENLKREGNLGDLNVYGSIILKTYLKEIWYGPDLSRSVYGTVAGFLNTVIIIQFA